MQHIQFYRDPARLLLLDQRLLPLRQEYLECRRSSDVVDAIRTLAVRGAPAIAVAAAYGCVLAAHEIQEEPGWRQKLVDLTDRLKNARPTAVNLAWSIERMLRSFPASLGELRKSWLSEAEQIQSEDLEICKKIGLSGAPLIKNGDAILTHCNAGALATAGYGTALGVIRSAWEQGKKISVIADETRPLLQGSRLTAFELAEDGIPVTVTCDNECAHLLANGLAQIVITGADRIAANGDTANKIGTCGVAIIAQFYNVPFYIAAPLSTIDVRARTGSDIPIEERPEAEVLQLAGTALAPEGVPAYNFAFDVTPARLISGIITEKGILRPPYQQSISAALNSC